MKEAAAAAASSASEKTPATGPASAAAAEADTNGKEEKRRLPQKLVDYVLSWTPEFSVDPDEYYAKRINDPFFSREYVERSTKTLRDVADVMVDYKAWVRAELEEKGYVDVAQGVRQSQELEEDDEFPEAFGPMEGLISDDTPQSVIDEIDGRVSESS